MRHTHRADVIRVAGDGFDGGAFVHGRRIGDMSKVDNRGAGREDTRPASQSIGDPTMALPTGYAPRCVAFIDILGFADKIARIEANERLFSQILAIRSIVDSAMQQMQGMAEVVHGPDIDTQWTAFSDSIVISMNMGEGHIGLYTLMDSVQRLARQLMLFDAPTRGGICKGLLYHKGDVSFGQAMIDAYRIESQVARWPRIVVHQEIVATWFGAFQNGRGLQALRDLIRRDEDGLHYVDLFHFPPNDSIDNATHIFFTQCRKILESRVNDAGLTLAQWSKNVWLATKYNTALFVLGSSRYGQIKIPEFYPGTHR
jgi:hypothetical protein